MHTLTVQAADVSVLVPKTITDSKPFTVSIDLNTGGIMINSFDIIMSYPKDLVSFKGYKEDASIKKLWLISPKEESGSIHFSGIIPGGVDGLYDPDKNGLQPIPIVQLLFTASTNGQGEFTITKSDILQNNGKGTALSHDVHNASISVSVSSDSKVVEGTKGDIVDIDLPEPFNIQYIVEGFFSRTPSMITFSAIDTGSGVEKYQLHTSRGWVDIASPLPTPKGLISRTIDIRALDFYGNARESEIEIPGLLTNSQILIILLLGVACYLIFFVLKRKR